MPVISVCDTYTPTRETYESVEAFFDMCEDCFGERPELRQTSAGVWTDEAATALRICEREPSRGAWAS